MCFSFFRTRCWQNDPACAKMCVESSGVVAGDRPFEMYEKFGGGPKRFGPRKRYHAADKKSKFLARRLLRPS